MEILFHSKSSWLENVRCDQLHQAMASNHITLLSKEGVATSLPVSLLTSSSSFLQSLLSTITCCTWSTISLPSITVTTVQLLSQLLWRGETDQCAGIDVTMENLREVESLVEVLGLDVKVSPKFGNVVDGTTVCYNKGIIETDTSRREDKQVDVSNNIDDVSAQRGAKTKPNIKGLAATKSRSKKFVPDIVEKIVIEKETISRLLHTCCVCGAKFKKSEALRKHCNFKHDGEGLDGIASNYVKCPHCHLRFSNKHYLKRHCNLKHTDVDDASPNEKKCPRCELSFSNYGSLRSHYRENHLKSEDADTLNVTNDINDPMMFLCRDSDTGDDVATVENPAKEENDHSKEKQNEKTVADMNIYCPKCNLSFKFLSNMLKHFQRKHKGNTGLEEEFECQDCNAKFSSKTGLGRHRSNKHTENSPNERVSYQCKYCQKPFADQSCLRRHIKHDHEEEATYGCGLCYHIAASKEDMTDHCEVNGHDLNRSYKISDSQLFKF